MKVEFNGRDVLLEIRKARSIRRKRSTWGTSSLNKYLPELLALHDEGASLGEMQFWLLKEKRIKVARSTIQRFLAQLLSVNNPAE